MSAITRGCGTRVKGGVYAAVDFSIFGAPVESFLFDPVLPIDFDEMGLSKRVPILREVGGSGELMLFDWVGETHYPNIADFIMEVKRMGFSRRLELPVSQYKKLHDKQKIVMVFPNAWMTKKALEHYYYERAPMLAEDGYKWDICPHDDHEHRLQNKLVNCAGLHWNRVDYGSQKIDDNFEARGLSSPRYVARTIGSTKYRAACSPNSALDEITVDQFKPGAVAMFEIKKLAIIADHESKQHDEKIKKLKGCQIPWSVVNE